MGLKSRHEERCEQLCEKRKILSHQRVETSVRQDRISLTKKVGDMFFFGQLQQRKDARSELRHEPIVQFLTTCLKRRPIDHRPFPVTAAIQLEKLVPPVPEYDQVGVELVRRLESAI